MCGDGKEAYRDLEPEPRSAEEIFRYKQERDRAMKERKHSTGTELMEDVMR
jgi:hypothetical protein